MGNCYKETIGREILWDFAGRMWRTVKWPVVFLMVCAFGIAVIFQIRRFHKEVDVAVAVNNMLHHMRNLDQCSAMYNAIFSDLVLQYKAIGEVEATTCPESGACWRAYALIFGIVGMQIQDRVGSEGARRAAPGKKRAEKEPEEKEKARMEAIRKEFRESPAYAQINEFFRKAKVEIGMAKNELLRRLDQSDKISGFAAEGDIKTLRLNPHLNIYTKIDMAVSMYLEKLAWVYIEKYSSGEYFGDHHQVETLLLEMANYYATPRIYWEHWVLIVLPALVFIFGLIPRDVLSDSAKAIILTAPPSISVHSKVNASGGTDIRTWSGEASEVPPANQVTLTAPESVDVNIEAKPGGYTDIRLS